MTNNVFLNSVSITMLNYVLSGVRLGAFHFIATYLFNTKILFPRRSPGIFSVPFDPVAAGVSAGGLAPGGRVCARRAGPVARRVGRGAGGAAAATHRAQARPLSLARAARPRGAGEQ